MQKREKMENKAWTNLKTLRDEVKLRGHLFNMETKEKWDELELKFENLNLKIENTAKTIGELSYEFWDGEKMIMDDIKSGLLKIKNNFKF